MKRTFILLVLLLTCINLVGCSKGPSNKIASKLAVNYLSGMIPGITAEEIDIVDTVEIGGNTTVLVRAGGMFCDMPVIKNNGTWEVGTMSCYGQFEPPERAVARLENTFRSRFKTKLNDINSKLLYLTDTNNVRYDKHEFDSDTAVYYVTLLGTRDTDCTNELISSKLKPLITSICSDYETHRDYLYYDVSYEFSYTDRNGNPTSKHIVNEDICNNKQLCQLAQAR